MFINALNNKIKLILIFLLLLTSVGIIYVKGFVLGVELTKGIRFTLEGENVLEAVDGVKNKYDIDKIEVVNDFSQTTRYNLYLIDPSEEESNAFKSELENIENIEITRESFDSSLSLDLKELIIFATALILFVFVMNFLMLRKILNFKQVLMLSNSGFATILVEWIVLAAILSVLSNFGWQISVFSINTFALIMFISVIVMLYYGYDLSQSLEDKIVTLSSNFKLYFEEKYKDLFKINLIISAFLLPFVIVQSLMVEIIILILSIWLVYVFSIIIIPLKIEHQELLFGKKSKKK